MMIITTKGIRWTGLRMSSKIRFGFTWASSKGEGARGRGLGDGGGQTRKTQTSSSGFVPCFVSYMLNILCLFTSLLMNYLYVESARQRVKIHFLC